MALVKGKGNKSTELKFRSLLRLAGITGWRRHYPILGKPDFAFPKHKVAVFLDGDFWHGRRIERLPKSNVEFWKKKIEVNKKRDRRVTRRLTKEGWRVVRIWESDLNKKTIPGLRRLEKLLAAALPLSVNL